MLLSLWAAVCRQEDDGSVRRCREPPGVRADAARAADREGRPGSAQSARRGPKHFSPIKDSGEKIKNCFRYVGLVLICPKKLHLIKF